MKKIVWKFEIVRQNDFLGLLKFHGSAAAFQQRVNLSKIVILKLSNPAGCLNLVLNRQTIYSKKMRLMRGCRALPNRN